ncbi:hypothetical protein C8N35_111130 [Breoghania corrubedonensis]|uniref:Uncharacterized protein n=1 Tax=Breoghania corrubedonensis TaxID=665038 RepID=A0A2T5UYV0_9HYPH|nr:hypothetical protein [Breoghania corrubedonensis]PTW56667.1 hypothetical protein C8N35_111130 [Breoghania corrubedonensis]
MANFWATTFSFPSSPAPDPNPLQTLPGSTDDGSAADINKANSEALFPYMDGSSEATSLESPKDSSGNTVDLSTVALTDITPEFFSGLHSSQQLQLLNRSDVDGELVLTGGGERLDVLLGSDGRTVLVLQALSKTDLAPMANDDQKLIADYANALYADAPDVVDDLAASWGVALGESADTYRSAMAALVQTEIDDINGDGSQHAAVFTEQLELIIDRIDQNSLFSSSNINSEISDITDRYKRMRQFEKTVAAQSFSDPETTVYEGLNSLDNNANIASGLNSFLVQEQRLLELAKQRHSLSQSASVQGKSLDLPSLISMLQLSYNIKKEAEVAVLTEELQQQNALLRDYAAMQKLVNDVLKQFPSGEDGSKQKRNISGSTGEPVVSASDPDWSTATMNLDVQERRAMIMFSSYFSGPNLLKLGHPLEALRGITRPLESFSKTKDGKTVLVEKTQSAWNIYSTQLADAVTLINQNSQILTNEISSINQERNRHFDLANNALRRLNDSLTSIARM